MLNRTQCGAGAVFGLACFVPEPWRRFFCTEEALGQAAATKDRVRAAMASLRFSCSRVWVSAKLSASRRLAKTTASAILLRLAPFAEPWPVRVRQES